MIYAVSDLHGCYDKFIRLLEKISFCDEDTLYILGDIVDRGNGGIKILKYIRNKKNIIPLVGNHDYTARIMLKNFAMSDMACELDFEEFSMWMSDGGSATFDSFTELDDNEKLSLLSQLNCFQIYEELEVKGKKFFLSHTVPEKERMKDFKSLIWQELIVGECEYDKQYFDDKYIVTGHTPTGLIDPSFSGKIYQKNHHIAIDCGAVFGGALGAICLDTFEEFYVTDEDLALQKADLSRFYEAHKLSYSTALEEIKGGRKQTHWMWYIFPQIKGLGHSEASRYYGIQNISEARDYLADSYLCDHLTECCKALLELKTNDPSEVLGFIDDMKLQSSMTLFKLASNQEDTIFDKVLQKFFDGKLDPNTKMIIGK